MQLQVRVTLKAKLQMTQISLGLLSLVSEVDNCGKSGANTCIEFDWGGTPVKL